MFRNTNTLRLSWIRGHQISSSTYVFTVQFAARRYSLLSYIALRLYSSAAHEQPPRTVCVGLFRTVQVCITFARHVRTLARQVHAGYGKPDLAA